MPKTHVLLNYGTEIDCNDLLPPAYFLENVWFTLSPHFKEINPPQILLPETAFTWSHRTPDYLMNAGLYPKDLMQTFQKHLLFPAEVVAAQSNLARESMGYSIYNQNLKLKSIIDEYTIENLVEQKLQKLWGLFTVVGNIASGFLGIFLIGKLLLIGINTIINFSILYETFGCSYKILAGLFSSITHYMMHKTHTNNYNKVYKNDIINNSYKSGENIDVNSVPITKNFFTEYYPKNNKLNIYPILEETSIIQQNE
ncbi:uncharacterized protein LOC126909914 [Daktulosphaira vitifoliae]|uniref:uncharacterized protein LOC126909914 n=1 Tax=Daktulosphaira vitifoliae TaxID=58002 RepID=UPI0021AA2C9B|nr:uncharacterized protein LOC126909914 [Daktulosphaira vitifoliae]